MVWYCKYCRKETPLSVDTCSTCGQHATILLPPSKHASLLSKDVCRSNTHATDGTTRVLYDAKSNVCDDGCMGDAVEKIREKHTPEANVAPSENTQKAKKMMFPIQIGPKDAVQTSICDFFEMPKRPGSVERSQTKREVKCHDVNASGQQSTGLLTPQTTDGEVDVVAYVKSTALLREERATFFGPVRLSSWDYGEIPASVCLVNDFDGEDPNRLLLVVDDKAGEIPDVILDAWLGSIDHLI